MLTLIDHLGMRHAFYAYVGYVTGLFNRKAGDRLMDFGPL